MGTLLLVRHGQASFGAEDYDHLSELGQRQCRCLGQWLAERSPTIATVWTGTLRRHGQSLQALGEGYGRGLPAPTAFPGLDEYDSLALIEALDEAQPLEEPLPPARTPEGYKAHFRRLRQALGAWMDGRLTPRGMPDYAAFRRGVVERLDRLCADHVGQTVLVVSSGGPISTAVSHVLQAPAQSSIDLNMRMRNSSLTEFVFNSRGHRMVTFNAVAHLDNAQHREWITHA